MKEVAKIQNEQETGYIPKRILEEEIGTGRQFFYGLT